MKAALSHPIKSFFQKIITINKSSWFLPENKILGTNRQGEESVPIMKINSNEIAGLKDTCNF